MLSRNLYEIDEVKSALQICLRRQSWRALFWLWELVVSEEVDEAKDVLHSTWLQWGAPYDIALLADIHAATFQAEDSEQCIALIRRIMTACENAGSIHAYRFLQEQEIPPYRLGWTTQAPTLTAAKRRKIRSAAFADSLTSNELSRDEAILFWIGMDSSFRRGAHRDAFWFLQAVQPVLSANEIWSALTISSRGNCNAVIENLQRTAPKHPTGQILHQAAAVLFLCTRVANRIKLATPTVPINRILQRDWDTWTANVNRRTARVHPIPPEALHSGTTRGQISARYTNIADIRDPIPLVLEGCNWWRRIASSVGMVEEDGCVSFPSDDTIEYIHDTYFPDDIPDEWSAYDQQKSHGQGVAECAPKEPTIWIRTERLDVIAWKRGCFLST
jgi:hypothetical protein